ncbi:MAG TPA: 3-oxoacyl-[acyl-carrier-protein] synthase III C-terminal domain-containing protein, partial [Actinomycetota bacterium]|nr:3-oxoacyl-[acyl-carrier-protein] synthase III C-terminal domain-containing protein [Actinomycetota bacterium]
LGLPPTTQRTHVGHMGCFAAVPALSLASDAAAARGLTTLVVCAELPTIHIQPPTQEIDQVLAHALFADAVSAAIVKPGGNGLRILGVASRTVPAAADLMAWDVTDNGFRMRLSPDVPRAVEPHIGPLVTELLGPRGLTPEDVATWGIHPGGPRILEVAAARLGVGAERMEASHAVLREAGNCSSATLLLILERILGAPPPAGSHIVGMAFGPGLTLTAALMRYEG